MEKREETLTHRIYSRNLVESKPSKNLLPKCLPDINYNIIVFTIARTVIYKQRCITPERKTSKSKLKNSKFSEET